MRRSQAFPSKYLGKDDLDSPILAIIKDVDSAMIKGDIGDECKTVMYFKDPNVKAWIINATNWMTIEDEYGEDSDDWIGKTIELYKDPNVMYGTKRVGGVRVRLPITAQATGQFHTGQVHFVPDECMTFDQAQEACAAVGISKEVLVESLKASGNAAYNSFRDTPHVLQIIENVKNRSTKSEPQAVTVPPAEDDIPF